MFLELHVLLNNIEDLVSFSKDTKILNNFKIITTISGKIIIVSTLNMPIPIFIMTSANLYHNLKVCLFQMAY